MPRAAVNGDGVVLDYEDTGPPSDSADYTTIVMVHGLVFYARMYLFPLTIAVNVNVQCSTV